MLIKKLCFFIFIITILILSSCKNIELPSREESKIKIDHYSHKIDLLRKSYLNFQNILGKTVSDLEIDLNLDVLNRVFRRFADSREDDIILIFPPTKPLLTDEKNIFGIKYSNFINIDTGNFEMNIKSLNVFHSLGDNVDVKIELEGKGTISISGKYTGIPVRANPLVEVYMNENVRFVVLPMNGEVIFKPLPKILSLKTRITIKLLNFDIPYYQEIPIQVTDLIKPFSLKLGFSEEIALPHPSINVPNTYDFRSYYAVFKAPKIKIERNRLLYDGSIELRTK
ncbi:MAG: hypothetical protein ACUVQ1_00665 [Candidatus Kapaibacteriales bacterium]